MRGNKGAFYCHLLPLIAIKPPKMCLFLQKMCLFLQKMCLFLQKTYLISTINSIFSCKEHNIFFKNTMIFFKNQYKESIDYSSKKTYPHGHEHLCPRTRVLLTEYFGHKCLEFRARLCNVSGNIPRRLKAAVRTSFASLEMHH